MLMLNILVLLTTMWLHMSMHYFLKNPFKTYIGMNVHDMFELLVKWLRDKHIYEYLNTCKRIEDQHCVM